VRDLRRLRLPGPGLFGALALAACAIAAPAPAAASRDERPGRVTVTTTGDVLTQAGVLDNARSAEAPGGFDFRPLLRRLEPRIARADLALCHQEIPIGPGPPSQVNYAFFGPASLADALGEIGWDACSVAANHSVDHGAYGIETTIAALEAAGLAHTGTYRTAAESRRSLILRVGGIRIALLSYTENTNGVALPEPFSVNVIDAGAGAEILADARRARRRGADAVIVNLHDVGDFFFPVPAYERRLVARLTASPAITAIVGQGPHFVRPIRFVNGKPVVYSTGDLLSAHPGHHPNGIIAELVLRAAPRGVTAERVRYVPLHMRTHDRAVVRIGPAFERDQANRGELRATYRRIVGRIGRSERVRPVPARLG
jgi:poly-gamma-glutamate capsule biosynthesis protein CapA/YwtB (metallophosphatase superfamily)